MSSIVTDLELYTVQHFGVYNKKRRYFLLNQMPVYELDSHIT